tara:strand:- start:1805 stop:3835 length:2031 start_codon:yes stop_codon:yes gene_type:complete
MENNGFFGGAFGSSGSSGGGGGGGDTIYTASSSLAGNIDVNLDTNILTFKNGTSYPSLLEVNSNGTLKFKNKLLISEFVGGAGDWANNVGFGHSALASTFNDDHAMIINQAGSVGINCPTGQRINFDQDNTVVFSLTPNGQFVYGSESVLGTEKVSLQGSTVIKGQGTSTGSTLALYNNDTTPVKTWDFLDNGNINLGVDSTVDLLTHTLTLDGTGNNGTPFQVTCVPVYTNDAVYAKVNLNGGMTLRGADGGSGGLKVISGYPNSTLEIFKVDRFGGGFWYGSSTTIGTSTTSSRLAQSSNNLGIYDVNNNLRHDIGLNTGSGNQYCKFFTNGYLYNGKFIVGSSAGISTEKISFQGSTLIKGDGTSTGSTLALYNNDTTPVKTWDFLDNGNVSVTQSSSFLLSANKTFKIDGSLNINTAKVFEVNSATNSFGQGTFTIGTYGDLIVQGRNSNGNFKVLTILGNELFTLDGNGNQSYLRTKAFDIGTSTTTGYKLSLDAGKHEFIRNTIMGANFDLVNSQVKFWEAGMTSRKFIVGATALIGTEKISFQDNTLIDGTLDMNNNRILNAVVNPSVQETTSTATFTINSDQQTDAVLTAMAVATTIAIPTGTPVQSQNLIFRFKDNGTARAITWNAIFRAIGITLPTTTTASKLLYVGCKYNSTDTKWDVVSVQEEA